jgi:hypothetical protein
VLRIQTHGQIALGGDHQTLLVHPAPDVANFSPVLLFDQVLFFGSIQRFLGH